jgi:hypothetical protein
MKQLLRTQQLVTSNTADLQSGGAMCEPRLEHRLYRVRFFVCFFNRYRKVLDRIVTSTPRLLLLKPSAIHS